MAHDDRRAIIRAYDRIAGEYLDQFQAEHGFLRARAR